MADDMTLAAYASHARDYERRFGDTGPGVHLSAFIALMPREGRVLDLGCGTGTAARHMVEAGLNVDAWDASPEMIAIARNRGLSPELRLFDELSAHDLYDGIYANFSLLHEPRALLPGHLSRIARALVPGGYLHLGMKTGTGEGRDRLGRFYAYWGEDELAKRLSEAGLAEVSRATGYEAGLAGTVEPWIIFVARRP